MRATSVRRSVAPRSATMSIRRVENPVDRFLVRRRRIAGPPVATHLPERGGGVELDGQARRPTHAEDRLPWCGCDRRGFGIRCARILSASASSTSGQVRAEAVVDAAAEGQDGRCRLSGDVEAVRFVVDGGIAVGREGVHIDEGARGEGESVEVDVLGRRFAARRRRRVNGACSPRRPSSPAPDGRGGPPTGRDESQSTSTEAASWFRVVSVPAINRLAASMRNSSALSRSPSSSARMRSDSRSSVRSCGVGRSSRRRSRRVRPTRA